MNWFGVRIWKTWTVNDEFPERVEESIHLFRATSEENARELGDQIVRNAERTFLNSDGDTVRINGVAVTHVFDTMEERIVSKMEVFSRLYEIEKSGMINSEWPL